MSEQDITLDYTNMLADALGPHGIAEARLSELARQFTDVHNDVGQRRESAEFGFYALPYETELADKIQLFADTEGQKFSNIVVLGIGGSALGTIALQQALLQTNWNELDLDARDGLPRLYVLDNIDPTTISDLFSRIDFRSTLFNVVSKSGATAETMAQFLIVRQKLEAELGDGYKRHLLFTTDPKAGVLRELADAEDIATLPVPANVGGRFSVLSPVGLLPAALLGIDIRELLAGAARMLERCDTDQLENNPAGLFAALQYQAAVGEAAPIHVIMPYSDRLYSVADWFCQLWAESLGKERGRNGEQLFTGPTPVKARGATDQHSQVQLYMEGPFDKTITFLAVRKWGTDLVIPQVYPDVGSLSYLGDHTLGELLDAERVATTNALTRHGRMNMTIELPEISAHSLGQLFMMLQIATVYAGGFYGVNPLDQPGVELGKQLTYGLMGRTGFEPPPAGTARRRKA